MTKSTEAWHQLSRDEQTQLLTKVNEARTQAGGKQIVHCTSGWMSEQWTSWGVEQFPALEAIQKHTALLNEFNWYRYRDRITLLGTELKIPGAR